MSKRTAKTLVLAGSWFQYLEWLRENNSSQRETIYVTLDGDELLGLKKQDISEVKYHGTFWERSDVGKIGYQLRKMGVLK